MGDGPTGKDRRRFNSAKASSLRQCQSCCSVCLCCLTSFVPKAWNPNLVDPHLELRAVYWIRVSFDHSQREFRGHQEEARRKVPVYNAHLNGAVVAFHAQFQGHSSLDHELCSVPQVSSANQDLLEENRKSDEVTPDLLPLQVKGQRPRTDSFHRTDGFAFSSRLWFTCT